MFLQGVEIKLLFVLEKKFNEFLYGKIRSVTSKQDWESFAKLELEMSECEIKNLLGKVGQIGKVQKRQMLDDWFQSNGNKFCLRI